MLRVILVTESAAEADRMRAALDRSGSPVQAVHVDTAEAWAAAAARPVDLVACRLPLPAGMTELRAPDGHPVPTLVFADACGPDVVSEALRLGASLCLPETGLAEALDRAAQESVARVARARHDAFETGQRRVLEQMAGVVPLSGLLEQIVRLIESQQEGLLCSILLLDGAAKRVRHGAAPSLPPEYVRAINGMPIGPLEGSCGAAAALGEPVFAEDIAVHPNWEHYREIALRHGLRASWSTPIFGPSDQILGTFAMYYREPRLPGPYEIALIAAATHLARIAILRHVNEERIRASERLRSVIHDQVTDVIFYLAVDDDTFRFVSVNPAFLASTGLTAEQVVGRTVQQVIPPESLDVVLANYRLAIAEERRVSWDEVSRYPAGTKWGEVGITPILGPSGRCEYLLGTVHDITERKNLEAQVVAAQRMESLASLAGGVAHDFNNLLAAIIGSVALARMVLPEDHPAVARLAIVDRATARASELVQQILTFSKTVPPHREALQVGPIVREALELLEATVLTPIEVRADLDTPTYDVLADSSQMHQIIVNLVTNAAHATESRPGVLRIAVRSMTSTTPIVGVKSCVPAGRYVQLTVADQGIGMTAETLEHIFEPFFTTKGKGTGLGLSVTLGIVRAHGGTITVSSRPGAGTTFDVFLPAVSGAVERTPSRPPPVGRGRGERIWYVDDDESLVTLATHHLATLGYEPTGFTDAQAALRAFREAPSSVDAIVVDYAMPGFSGIDLLRDILRVSPALPAVVVDRIVTPELEDETRTMGVRAVLAKADIPHGLPEVLEEVLSA